MNWRRTGAGEAPLLAWGEALRRERQARQKLRRRIVMVQVGATALLVSVLLPPTPRLIWNVSSSAPRGLYAVAPGAGVEVGDMVIARVPRTWRDLAAERRYLPSNVPLVKRVAAVAGDEVCASGESIFVNGHWLAQRRSVDGAGRVMPRWSGCLRLRGRQLFLLMDSANSFDGRYFGITEGDELLGKARLLWVR